jgi:protein-S-isoprenylcysteine O-methyltransferase Ste14
MLIRLFALVRGLAYAAAFTALWWWVVVAARQLDPRLGVTLPSWAPVLGVALVLAGSAVVLSCVLAFALAGKGTPAPFDAPREFVAAGPYRIVRNPMYLGAAAVIAGAGLMLRSPAAAGVAILFLAATHAFVLLYEEPTLERRFGESYRRYKRRVPRWLPRVPRRDTDPPVEPAPDDQETWR